MLHLRWAWLVVLAASASARADEPVWKVVFADDFNRGEIGDAWEYDPDHIRIIDGRLFIDECGGCSASPKHGFGPDVKVEFVAEANPDAPPCDIAVRLSSTYLLQFGGRNNQANAIYGIQVDLDPPFRIEHGKKYRCIATQEGSRLTYEVNGTMILDAKVPDIVGGPGFDRVGLVTWHGMFVEDLKIYERTTPAEGGPVILRSLPDLGYRWENLRLSHDGPVSPAVRRGIDAYNARRYEDAIREFASDSEPTLMNAAGMAYVIGDLYFEETSATQRKLAEFAQQVAAAEPSDAARNLALAARWFSGINLKSRDEKACKRLLEAGPKNNPFYYKAQLYMARYTLAHGKEGARRALVEQAIGEFKELKKLWPAHQSLREFTGESIPWGEQLTHPENDGPAWARYLQEALARQHAILNWWATVRQYPDGELGGGWGDDVEILRSWVPVSVITSATKTAAGAIEKLAQGVWDHVLKDGYDAGIGDVEHSAEPSADSLPTMILLRYGDPKWVEYNLRSAKTIREKFMDLNERGFLQFKSTNFGSGGVYTGPGDGGDTGYHARAMKHHIWLAWQGIPEAREQFAAWCDMWQDVTMRRIGSKPGGFPPASVFYPSGGIDPPTGKPWYHTHSHSYGFPGLPNMVYASFMTAGLLTGDPRYLDPLQTMMEMATIGPLRKHDPSLPPDHPDNLLAIIAHCAAAQELSVYRWLTGDRTYDEYILRFASPTQRYFVDRDLDAYTRAFQGVASRLRTNWTQHTVEVIQTDRAGLASAAEVFGAYTGAVRDLRDMGAPTMGVTWETEDLDFAALVTENTPERLRVMLYSFHDTPTRMGLRPWQLVPGTYVLTAGEPVPGEMPFQKRYTWTAPQEVQHLRRGTPIDIEVPPGRQWVVDLRLRRKIERPDLLPDLAIASRDVAVHGRELSVTVHNIGGAAAGAFDVLVQTLDAAGGWVEAARTRVDGLPAITRLEPVVRTLQIELKSAPAAGGLRVVVDPDDRVDELYELNNATSLN